MPDPQKDGLQIERDASFQRREWLIQRVGWVAMTAVLAAALAGLLGDGPLSHAVAGERGGALWIEYQRFGRWQAPEEMHVHLGAGQAKGGRARIWLDRDFVERLEIDGVTPPPAAVEARADRATYEFLAPEEGGDLEITFNVKPQHWGRKHGRIGVEGGPAVAMSELVYP